MFTLASRRGAHPAQHFTLLPPAPSRPLDHTPGATPAAGVPQDVTPKIAQEDQQLLASLEPQPVLQVLAYHLTSRSVLKARDLV